MPLHYVTKHLQQGIESGHLRVKEAMPRVGSFRSFSTAQGTLRTSAFTMILSRAPRPSLITTLIAPSPFLIKGR
jgi:hypothetical protein